MVFMQRQPEAGFGGRQFFEPPDAGGGSGRSVEEQQKLAAFLAEVNKIVNMGDANAKPPVISIRDKEKNADGTVNVYREHYGRENDLKALQKTISGFISDNPNLASGKAFLAIKSKVDGLLVAAPITSENISGLLAFVTGQTQLAPITEPTSGEVTKPAEGTEPSQFASEAPIVSRIDEFKSRLKLQKGEGITEEMRIASEIFLGFVAVLDDPFNMQRRDAFLRKYDDWESKAKDSDLLIDEIVKLWRGFEAAYSLPARKKPEISVLSAIVREMPKQEMALQEYISEYGKKSTPKPEKQLDNLQTDGGLVASAMIRNIFGTTSQEMIISARENYGFGLSGNNELEVLDAFYRSIRADKNFMKWQEGFVSSRAFRQTYLDLDLVSQYAFYKVYTKDNGRLAMNLGDERTRMILDNMVNIDPAGREMFFLRALPRLAEDFPGHIGELMSVMAATDKMIMRTPQRARQIRRYYEGAPKRLDEATKKEITNLIESLKRYYNEDDEYYNRNNIPRSVEDMKRDIEVIDDARRLLDQLTGEGATITFNDLRDLRFRNLEVRRTDPGKYNRVMSELFSAESFEMLPALTGPSPHLWEIDLLSSAVGALRDLSWLQQPYPEMEFDTYLASLKFYGEWTRENDDTRGKISTNGRVMELGPESGLGMGYARDENWLRQNQGDITRRDYDRLQSGYINGWNLSDGEHYDVSRLEADFAEGNKVNARTSALLDAYSGNSNLVMVCNFEDTEHMVARGFLRGNDGAWYRASYARLDREQAQKLFVRYANQEAFDARYGQILQEGKTPKEGFVLGVNTSALAGSDPLLGVGAMADYRDNQAAAALFGNESYRATLRYFNFDDTSYGAFRYEDKKVMWGASFGSDAASVEHAQRLGDNRQLAAAIATVDAFDLSGHKNRGRRRERSGGYEVYSTPQMLQWVKASVVEGYAGKNEVKGAAQIRFPTGAPVELGQATYFRPEGTALGDAIEQRQKRLEELRTQLGEAESEIDKININRQMSELQLELARMRNEKYGKDLVTLKSYTHMLGLKSEGLETAVSDNKVWLNGVVQVNDHVLIGLLTAFAGDKVVEAGGGVRIRVGDMIYVLRTLSENMQPDQWTAAGGGFADMAQRWAAYVQVGGGKTKGDFEFFVWQQIKDGLASAGASQVEIKSRDARLGFFKKMIYDNEWFIYADKKTNEAKLADAKAVSETTRVIAGAELIYYINERPIRITMSGEYGITEEKLRELRRKIEASVLEAGAVYEVSTSISVMGRATFELTKIEPSASSGESRDVRSRITVEVGVEARW